MLTRVMLTTVFSTWSTSTEYDLVFSQQYIHMQCQSVWQYQVECWYLPRERHQCHLLCDTPLVVTVIKMSFFGSLMITLYSQLAGTVLLLQLLLKISVKLQTIKFPPSFRGYAGMLSTPTAFLSFNILTAFTTSSTVIWPVLNSSSSMCSSLPNYYYFGLVG